MLSISSLIQFLMDLLRDEDAQAEFARDPAAVLARHGLEGVTAQDVADIAPMLADCQGVTQRPDHVGVPHDGYGDDPVRAIQHATNNYQVVGHDHAAPKIYNSYSEYNQYSEYHTEINYYDDSVTTGDGSTVIQDSFNQDNDGVDNKGGSIVDSNVAGAGQDTVGNAQETTAITDSFDEDAGETVVVVDSNNDTGDHSTTVVGSFDDGSANSAAVNNSYDVHAHTPALDVPDDVVPADAVA